MTTSGEDYLKAVLILQRETIAVRSIDLAEQIYEHHCFFRERLLAAGIDPQTAEIEACRMEHTVSRESFKRLREAYAKHIQ